MISRKVNVRHGIACLSSYKVSQLARSYRTVKFNVLREVHATKLF